MLWYNHKAKLTGLVCRVFRAARRSSASQVALEGHLLCEGVAIAIKARSHSFDLLLADLNSHLVCVDFDR